MAALQSRPFWLVVIRFYSKKKSLFFYRAFVVGFKDLGIGSGRCDVVGLSAIARLSAHGG